MTDDDEASAMPAEGAGMMRALPEIGRPGPAVDILFGGDVDPATGRLLSIAQLQAQLRARAGLLPGPTPAAPSPADHASAPRPAVQPVQRPAVQQPPPPTWQSPPPDDTEPAQTIWPIWATAAPVGEPASRTPEQEVDVAPRSGPLRWIAVIGAQPGAGCTVTALAMADGAAQLDRPVHLVGGGGYGLTGVADRELGVVEGGWQRGRRGDVVMDHTAGYPVTAWPPIPTRPDVPVTTILDAGSDWDAGWWWPVPRPPLAVVITCRANVPGVICAERVLDDLTGKPGLLGARRPGSSRGLNPLLGSGVQVLEALMNQPGGTQVVVAAVGRARWHSSVRGACGPLLSQVMDSGHVIAVPHIRRMEVSGPTADALPRQLIAAGRALWTVAAGHDNDNGGQ